MRFWIALTVGLMVAFGVALALHYCLGWDGFFLNLATESIGILVTVAIVDRLLARHEVAQWKEADSQIRRRLQVFVNSAISEIRVTFQLYDALDSRVPMTDCEALHKEVVRTATQIFEPMAADRIAALDIQGWKRLYEGTVRVHSNSDFLIQRFSHRLSPAQQKLLLEIQDAAFSATILYYTIPEFAGSVRDPLPPSNGRTNPEELRRSINSGATEGVRKLLKLSADLSNTLYS